MATSRYVTVTSPLEDQLVLRRMTGREELGQPFVYELELLSSSFDIEAADLLGEHMTVHLETVDKELRHFDGVVAQFAFIGTRGRYAAYRATLRPWLWLLTQIVGNEVFVDRTVPDLVRERLAQSGYGDLGPSSLTGTYDKRELIVQYRESLLQFVSRWLEHEGIYYTFTHEEGGHKLCLADDSTTGSSVPRYEELSYRAPTAAGREDVDHFDQWHELASVIPEAYMVDGYNFKTPNVDLQERTDDPDAKAGYRLVMQAPATHLTSEAGSRYSKLYAQEHKASQVVFEGEGNVRGLRPGALFKLKDHPRQSFNREYCVVSTEYHIEAQEFESRGGGGGAHQIRTRVRAIGSDVPFRTARRTPWPVAGTESAVVVGTQGSEISTEKYGRIRVQFHWDGVHQRNEESSCWIRVSQPWAGPNYGFQFIPRVGQEVLVDFLNGNPDEPIVIGSVHNEANQLPFELDKHRTQSGIRTRSSKGGGKDDYNELRFEDDAGHEEVYLQAQRNLRELVKNDHDTTVKANQKNSVGKDHTEDVQGEQKLSVKGDRTVHVEGSHSTTIDGGGALDGVTGSKLTITGDYEVGVSQSIHITAPVSIKLECGASTLLMEPTKISLIAGGQAVLVLDTSAYLESPVGASLKLDMGVLAQAALGGKLELTQDAAMEGLQSTLSGKVAAQTVSGANSVKADPSGVSVLGTPMVRIN